MGNIIWKGLIATSIAAILWLISKVILITLKGVEISWIFNDFSEALPICAVCLIIANFIKPISLMDRWFGKSIAAAAIFASTASFVSTIMFVASSYSISNTIIPISNTAFQLLQLLISQAFIILTCIIPFVFKNNPRADNTFEETFS